MKQAAVRRFYFLMLENLLLFSQVSCTYLEYVAWIENPLNIFRKCNFLSTPLPVNVRCIEYKNMMVNLDEYFPIIPKSFLQRPLKVQLMIKSTVSLMGKDDPRKYVQVP